MRVIKILPLLLIVLMLAFVLWMNITPGHFQGTCTCQVVYLTNEEAEAQRNGICTVVGLCIPSPVSQILNPILILVSNLDFYK